jgi:RNA polymerase sigma-B factor
VTAAPSTGSSGEYDHLAPQFRELAALPSDDPRRTGLRDHLVTAHLAVARNIARRFSNRGEPQDDLVQVATVGLIHAVDRFDPERGFDFLSFAVPTIVGEVRRHFRDASWSVHVPRRLKELHTAVGSASSELSQSLGRSPSPSELAAHLGMTKEQIYEGLEASSAYRSLSLDELTGANEDSSPLVDRIGTLDSALDGVEVHESLQPLLAQLPDRERKIVILRFYGNMTQTQIAQRMGISQMHVSRLLATTLQSLRRGLTDNG